MKKLLLASLLAVSLTPALAQSNVSVYGTLDYGVRRDSSATQNAVNQTQSISGFQSTSNFGITGSEAVGAQTFKFKLESGLSLINGQSSQTGTAGTNVLFDRAAWVGVADRSMGEVQFGRNTHANFDLAAAGITDPLKLAYDGVGAPNVVSNSTYGVGALRINQAIVFAGSSSGSENSRSDGLIKYTNQFGPVGVTYGYALGGVAGNNSAKSSQSGGLTYTQGAMNLGIGSFRAYDAAYKAATSDTFGGNYTLGSFTVTAGHYKQHTDAGYVPTNLTIGATYKGAPLSLTTTSGPSTDATATGVGVKWQQTPNMAHTLARYNGTYNNGAGYTGNLYTTIWLTEYNFSKTTNLYAALDHSLATNALIGTTTNPTNNGVTVGVRYRF